MKILRNSLLILSVIFSTAVFFSGSFAQTSDLPAVGTVSENLKSKSGVKVNVTVQSPPDMKSDLQIMCFFEYREGEYFGGADIEADEKLGGLIQDLRKSGKFSARPLETILITPPAGRVGAKQMLFIGLGKQEDLTLDLMRIVGRIGMREALRLGVKSYSESSNLVDGGNPNLGTGNVAEAVISGALEAYPTEMELQNKGFSKKRRIKSVAYLSGQKYFADTLQSVKKAVSNF